MRALVGWKMRDVFAKQPDLSCVWTQIPANLVEQRRLAGAVWADDQSSFARSDVQRNILRNGQSTEGLLEIVDFKCRDGSHRRSPRSPAISLLKPGTTPVGITSTIKRNTRPSSMFHRSM